jgi:chromatin remodeling complex protein RSC6
MARTPAKTAEAPKAKPAAKPKAAAAPKKAAPAKSTAAPKSTSAKTEAPAKKRSAGALAKPMTPSSELAKIVGSVPLPRTEVVSKIWEYIRKHSLQNPENKREIVADSLLTKVFGQAKATMFEMNKLISKHLT